MKHIIYLFFLLSLISCSESGDKYIGNYTNNFTYAKILKAGDEGYFLIYGEKNEGEKSYYCIYKKGCFVKMKKDEEFPLMCINGDQLISNNGIIFKKLK